MMWVSLWWESLRCFAPECELQRCNYTGVDKSVDGFLGVREVGVPNVAI